MNAPWEEGTAFNLSASEFLWDEGGSSGTFVGWDDDCGTLYRVDVPEPGTWGGTAVGAPGSKGRLPIRLQSPGGCHRLLRGTGVGAASRRLWLETGPDDEVSQNLLVVGDDGAIVDEIVFPPGRPLHAQWGSSTGASNVESDRPRPPIAGWSYDAGTRERVLFVWGPGSLVEWYRELCADDCADPIALTPDGLFYLAGSPGAARLKFVSIAGAAPVELLPAPVTELIPSPDGRRLLVVRVDGGRHGVWLLGDAPRPEP